MKTYRNYDFAAFQLKTQFILWKRLAEIKYANLSALNVFS